MISVIAIWVSVMIVSAPRYQRETWYSNVLPQCVSCQNYQDQFLLLRGRFALWALCKDLCKDWTASWRIGPTLLLGCRSSSLFHWHTCGEDCGVRFSRDKVASACSVDLLFLGEGSPREKKGGHCPLCAPPPNRKRGHLLSDNK